MSKSKFNDEEKSLISSLNVSQNESNFQLVSGVNKQKEDKGVFGSLNSQSKSSKKDSLKNNSNPQKYLHKNSLTKNFKEDIEDNKQPSNEAYVKNKNRTPRSKHSECSQVDYEDQNRCLLKRDKIVNNLQYNK